MCPRRVTFVHISLDSVGEIKQLTEVHPLLSCKLPSLFFILHELYINLIKRIQILSCVVTQTVETQCEMDEEMTVRNLPLESQGLLESYLPPR